MQLEEIKQLVELFHHSDLNKMHLKWEKLDLLLEKGNNIPVAQMPQVAVIPSPENSSISVPKEEKQEIQTHTINAPMVGTFYAASSPDAKPFVTVGTKVKKGDVVCIIEAMKLMNEVEADIDGEIVEIVAENGQMVEYGQPLFVIKP